MDKSTVLVEEFNNHTLEFLKQSETLCSLMESDAIKKTDILKLENAIYIDSEFAIKLFLRHVQKYKDKIDSDDYTFIDKIDIKKINLTGGSGIAGNISIGIINKYLSFIKLFKKLNPDNKATLFKYLKLLCNICLKYAEINILKPQQNLSI